MIYITCPSCGYFLGNKSIEYESEKTKICDNPDLTDKQRINAISNLIISLKLRRYCCKMRIMTTKLIVQDILPATI